MGMMTADVQELPVTVRRSIWSILRSSIVWKLTLFVGVLVTLTSGALIAVAFFAIGTILRDQIHDRLLTVASDRQEMLAYTLQQQEERATQIAGWNRIQQILARRANGSIDGEHFRIDGEALLSSVRINTARILGLWIEDDSGTMLASSGPDGLIVHFSFLRRNKPISADVSLVVSPQRLGEIFACVYSSVVRGRDGRDLGKRSRINGLRAHCLILDEYQRPARNRRSSSWHS